MPEMPKKLANCLLYCVTVLLLWIPPAAGVTIHEIGTGNPESASWWFTEELSNLWKLKYPDQEIVFVPIEASDFSERFRLLSEGKRKFVIAPIKSFFSEDAYYPQIKVLLPLWEVSLVPLTGSQQLSEVTTSGFEPWYIPENSFLIKKIFFNQDEFELSHSIITLNQNELSDYIGYLGEEILFYEMTGSMKELKKVLGPNLRVLGIDRDLRIKMKEELPWLRSILFPVSGQQKIATIGFKMGLFINEEEDPEFLKAVKNLITDPPGRYLPNSYLFRNLKNEEQSSVDSELRYYPPAE
ncbi:MAG: hypothetical protein GY786_13545 [Proteobacteria bacterium]|nr:hypothetical protein [Pseudomonadota bacterium]